MAMPADTLPPATTAEELLRIRIPGKWTELIRGRLVVREPAGTEHGRIAANLCYFVIDFARRHGLGQVFAQDTGFKIESNPDTVRAPDLAFISLARCVTPGEGYAAIAPDLVAEVVSRGDRPGEVLEKVGNWLEAGVRLAWVIDPHRCEARVYRPDGSVVVIDTDGVLDGEDVLPGFTCKLADVLG
jgi:Uma2 family endonuclease